MLHRLGCAAGLWLTTLPVPVAAADPSPYCDPALLLPVLERTVPRFAADRVSFDLADPDMRLLAEVVETARRNAELKRSGSSDIFERLVRQLFDGAGQAGWGPRPTLAPEERHRLARWRTNCSPQQPDDIEGDDPQQLIPGFRVADAVGISGRSETGPKRASAPPRQPARQANPTRSPTQDVRALWTTLSILFLFGLVAAAARYAILQNMRRSVRHPCRVRSRVRLGAEKMPAIILDISHNGCKIHVRHRLTDRTECHVWVAGAWREGRVKWSNLHYAGIDFRHALGHQALMEMLRFDEFGDGARRQKRRTPPAAPPDPLHARAAGT